jgi:uncharacterized protein YqgQ
MKDLIEIIQQEIQEVLDEELLDMNFGGTYFPPDLDPKVMKLFEKQKKKKNEEPLGKD